jgi:hypothetical protein
MFVVGLISDITAAVFFLVSGGTRDWLHENYMAVALAGLILVATNIATLNFLLRDRDQMDELRVENEQLTSRLQAPTPHDVSMFNELNRLAAPQSHLMVWLREGFLLTRATRDQMRELEDWLQFFERDPRGFDDSDLDEKFEVLIQSARGLLDSMSANMWYEGEWLSIPAEWDLLQPERLRRAMDDIGEAHDALLDAYDAFFVLTQQKRISVVETSRPAQ